MRSWLKAAARMTAGAATGLVRDTWTLYHARDRTQQRPPIQRTVLRAAGHVRYPSHDARIIMTGKTPSHPEGEWARGSHQWSFPGGHKGL
jgi:hypothetical protein